MKKPHCATWDYLNSDQTEAILIQLAIKLSYYIVHQFNWPRIMLHGFKIVRILIQLAIKVSHYKVHRVDWPRIMMHGFRLHVSLNSGVYVIGGRIWPFVCRLRANRHLESFKPGTSYIYKFSLLVSFICVTFARLHTLHHVAWNWQGGWNCICIRSPVKKPLGVCWP